MRIKDGYMLSNVAGKYIVVPIGNEAIDFNGVITTNESGAFLWKCLEKDITEKELLDALLNEYDIEEETALADITDFINKLTEAELLV